MMRILTLVIVAVGLGCAAPLSAQDDPFLDPEQQVGTRFKQAPETAEEAEARAMQKEVARCVFERNQDEVRELLAHSDMGRIDFVAIEQDPETFFDDLNVSQCMSRAMKYAQYKLYMRMPYATLRNLLAEEAYLRDHQDALELPAGARQGIEQRYGYEGLHPRTAVMTDLADCVSFNGALQAHALLDSRPGSKDEGEALAALLPTLGVCLKSDGEIEVHPSLVRQAVAEGMWARGHYGSPATAEAAE